MKASRPTGLPPPMTDSQLVHRLVQTAVCRGRTNDRYWDLVYDIGFMFGVGILEANHIARRHVDFCWLLALEVGS